MFVFRNLGTSKCKNSVALGCEKIPDGTFARRLLKNRSRKRWLSLSHPVVSGALFVASGRIGAGGPRGAGPRRGRGRRAPARGAGAVPPRAERRRPRSFRATRNFTGLVLGCIEADFCKQILILRHFPRSTRLSFLRTAPNSKITDFFVFKNFFAKCWDFTNFC